MAAFIKLFLLPIFVICFVDGSSYDPLKIQQPSISLTTEQNGFIGLASGDDGDIYINKDTNTSVYLDGEDLLYIIEMIESQPPVWQMDGPVSGKTPYGYLGEFRAGQRINIKVSAVDPEGKTVTYSRVAGDFPPGVHLDSASGAITGIIPDADATYSFTIRATDGHGKYADNIFRIVVKGYDRCSNTPCLHEGVCTDKADSFTCNCVRPYGGVTCNLACGSNPLGIQSRLRYVKDAQITAFNSYSTYDGYNYARLGQSGWWGKDSSSYVQIDFGNMTDIYRVDMAYYDKYRYTQYYYMQYSVDGNNFYNYTDFTGNTQRLYGNTGSGTRTLTLPSVLTTRFVRLFPLTWNRSYYPAFAIEMYGCYSYKN